MTQRDFMRKLAKELGRHNRSAIVLAYAKAEVEGKVHRKNNLSKYSPIDYAEAMYRDMINKGW